MIAKGGQLVGVNARQVRGTWMQRTDENQAGEAPNRREDVEYLVAPSQMKKGKSTMWLVYKQLVAESPISGNGVATVLTPGWSQPTPSQVYG